MSAFIPGALIKNTLRVLLKITELKSSWLLVLFHFLTSFCPASSWGQHTLTQKKDLSRTKPFELPAFKHNLLPKLQKYSEELHMKKTTLKSGEVEKLRVNQVKQDFPECLIFYHVKKEGRI